MNITKIDKKNHYLMNIWNQFFISLDQALVEQYFNINYLQEY